MLRRVLTGATILLVLGALGYRIASILAPPTLALREPSDRLSTSSRTITIAGETEPGVTLTINGEAFVPDQMGAFTTDVVLLPGVNTIAIEARRRHGWPARVERRVHVRAADAPLARLPRIGCTRISADAQVVCTTVFVRRDTNASARSAIA